MKRAFIAAMIVGLLFGLCAIALSAQDSQIQKIAEGKKYLDKMATALGGRDRILKMGNSKLTLEYRFLTGVKMSTIRTIYTKDFSKIRMENNVMGTIIAMAYNGKTGWINVPRMGLMDMPESEQAGFKRSAMGTKALINPDEFGIVATFEGRKTIASKEYIIIKQTYGDGYATDIYLDDGTYLPYKTVALSLNESKQKVETEEIMSDYRDVEGVKVPFATKILQGGVEFAAATLNECIFRQNLSDSLFEKPEKSAKSASNLWADEFLGTWKLSIAKSKIAQNQMIPKERIFIVRVLNSDELECTGTIVLADGSTNSRKYIIPRQGGIRKYQQGGPGEELSIIDVLIGPNDGYTASLLNGKQFGGATHWLISQDGKTMLGTTKGTDPKGQPAEELEFWEKQ
jgi:hypothetical protein